MNRELALLAALLAVSAAARLQVDEPMGSSLDDFEMVKELQDGERSDDSEELQAHVAKDVSINDEDEQLREALYDMLISYLQQENKANNYEYIVGMLDAGYNWICQPVDYSYEPAQMRIASALWWYYFSKFIEFFDTFFFILRKKDEQVTFLHVYHHASMFLLWWIGMKWVAGGQSVSAALLNSIIHVIMSTYLRPGLSGVEDAQVLVVEETHHHLQLLQFSMAIIHAAHSLYIDCDFPKWMHYTCIGYAISFVVLFTNFYIHAYIKKNFKDDFHLKQLPGWRSPSASGDEDALVVIKQFTDGDDQNSLEVMDAIKQFADEDDFQTIPSRKNGECVLALENTDPLFQMDSTAPAHVPVSPPPLERQDDNSAASQGSPCSVSPGPHTPLNANSFDSSYPSHPTEYTSGMVLMGSYQAGSPSPNINDSAHDCTNVGIFTQSNGLQFYSEALDVVQPFLTRQRSDSSPEAKTKKSAKPKPRKVKPQVDVDIAGIKDIATSSQLWEFTLKILERPSYSYMVSWENKKEGVFRFHNAQAFATLWGRHRNRPNMTYDKVARALRYYYKRDILNQTPEGESRTVSLTGQQATDGPTPPKAEMKKPQLKSCFMSPTDAMMSPCTQKLLGPKKGHRKPATQMRPDRAAMMAADAGESSQLREIAAVITRLPVEPGVTRMAAGDWVMDPGEMETEGEETMAEVAARLLGQTTSFTSLDVDEIETQDPNNEEPQSVSFAEAKDSVSSLLQFVGDNIGIFSEEDFSHLVYLQDKMQSNVFDA
eukprot:Em0003g298a